MKQTIKVILGSHHHSASGSSDDDFARVYELKLKPFITALYKFPHIPVVLHYSGVLLYWIERHHPEFFMILEDMISRKQLEFLGGGFYEPLMPLISSSDKIGQIEMLTTYLRKQFGKRPQGCWIPYLSWDQSLVGALSTSGMNFTFLDEHQFRLAGNDTADYPCITEDMGKLLTVFPIASRYHASFAEGKAGNVLDTIIAENSGGTEKILSIFPEQFCKETNNAAEIELAVHDFFEELTKRSDIITWTTPGKLLKSLSVLEKIYIPSSASPDCMYWAGNHADTEQSNSFTGSMTKNFLVKYPEANGMYAKMNYTSMLISQLRGDKSRKLTAREELWKAQGCDAFCHIGDGGIYANNLRKAVYKSLLEAEKITREKRDFIPSLAAFDFTLDGESEFLFQNKDINVYVKRAGAGIFELDYLPKAWNYLDTLSRRKEAYITQKIVEDDYRRSAFLDRLVPANITFEDAQKAQFGEHRFCGKEAYTLVDMDRPHQKAVFSLPKNPDLPFGSIEIEKQYQLKKDALSVSYTLTNRDEKETAFQFIPEIDLSFAGDTEKFLRLFRIENNEKAPLSPDQGKLDAALGLELRDVKNEVVINLLSDIPLEIWIFPIRTVCRINDEIVEQYQSTCIMPIRKLSLKPGESCKTVFTLKFYH